MSPDTIDTVDNFVALLLGEFGRSVANAASADFESMRLNESVRHTARRLLDVVCDRDCTDADLEKVFFSWSKNGCAQ